MERCIAVCDGSAFTVADSEEIVSARGLRPGRSAGELGSPWAEQRASDFLIPETPAEGEAPGSTSSTARAPMLPSLLSGGVSLDEGDYQGDRQQNLRHGRGTMKFSDGREYEGQWVQGVPSGEGRYCFPAIGCTYEGQWLQGQAHGQGKYSSDTQLQYSGQWKCDALNGEGRATWPDGSSHWGHFKDGVRHGKGHSRWPDNCEYDGDYRADCRHGQGVYRWHDGRQYKGQWQNNQMHGEGIFHWPDGRIYEGGYKNGKKHGPGTLSYTAHNDCRRYQGEWKEGKLHGLVTYSCWLSTAQRGVWKAGKPVKWLAEGEEPDSHLFVGDFDLPDKNLGREDYGAVLM